MGVQASNVVPLLARRYQRTWLPVSDLYVDEQYQAPLRHRQLAQMVREFNVDLLLPIVVNKRQDGSLWVVDGRHRLEATKQATGPHARLESLLYDGLTPEEEAELYYLLNTAVRRKPPTAIFHARLTAGEAAATEIEQLCRGHGWKIHTDRRTVCPPEGIRAVNVLDDLYRIGGPLHLEAVLGTLSAAWYGKPGAASGEFLLAMHVLLAAHPDVDQEDLAKRIAQREPRQDLNLAQGAQPNAKGLKRAFHIYKLWVEQFNHGRRQAGRLIALRQMSELRQAFAALQANRPDLQP